MFLFVLVISLSAASIVRSDTDVYGTLFGKGVCSIHTQDTKQVLILNASFYSEEGYSLCWKFPPWCKTTTGRELIEFTTIPEDINHEFLSLKCCDGYHPSKDELSCMPICSKRCLPSKCLSPNECTECDTGYYGPTCTKVTPPNSTTTIPPVVCNCPNENYKCTHDLQCVCIGGFDGPTCQHIIPSHRIVVNPDNCTYYAEKVAVLITAMAASAILLAILMKKRVCWNNTFELLNDRNLLIV